MSDWKKVLLPAALLLAVVAMLIRVDAGIWDPWEMNRAHVARQLAGRPKVLVVEPADELLPRLEADRGRDLFIVGARPAPVVKGKSPKGPEKNRPTTNTRLLDEARDQLENEVYHAIYVDVAAVSREPLKGVEELTELRAESPGARFYLFAPTEERCQEAVNALEIALAEQAVTVLQEGYRLLPEEFDGRTLARERAGAYPFTLDIPCLATEGEAIGDSLAGLSLVKWTRVQFKGLTQVPTKKQKDPPTATWSVPPLDYWLAGISYLVFGFSETSSRLPGLLFGIGTLLLMVLGVRRYFGERTALLATLVLITMPMFFAQAKNMGGEMSYTFFLAAGVFLFAGNLTRPWSWGRVLGLLGIGLGLFLAKGLFGMATLVLVIGAYALVARDWRRGAVLLPLAALGLLFGILVLLVQIPNEWTFFTHFKFMNRPFQGGPVEGRRTFEFFVRHVSFAVMPWTLLMPFAFARLVPLDKDRPTTDAGRLGLLTLLWFAVPFTFHSALLPGFLHTIFPAATALALAVALLWQAEEKEGINRFQAFVAVGIGAVLLANLFKNPVGLFSFLTSDPEFGSDVGQQKFPPDFTITAVGKGLLAALTLVITVYYARGGSIFRELVAFFRRRLPFWIALWSFAALFVIRLVAGMASRYQMALTSKEAGRIPIGTVEFYRELFGLRLETLMLYIGLGGVALAALLFLSPVGRYLARKLRFLGGVGWVLRYAQGLLDRDLIGLPLAGALALAGLVDILVTFDFPPGSLAAVAGSASFIAAWVLLGVTVVGGVAGRFLIPWLTGWTVRWSSVLRAIAGAAVIAVVIVTSALFRQTDLGAPDIWILALSAFVVLGIYGLRRLLDEPALLHAVAWGLLLALGVALVAPLAWRWPGVERLAFPKSQVHYLHYLFLESRLTWLPLVFAGLLVTSALFPAAAAAVRSWGPIDRAFIGLGRWNPSRWPDEIERPAVATTVIVVLALCFGGFYAVYLLPAFSREVSQKHILELYYGAEDRSDLGENIFKYQGTKGRAAEDRNFYTAQIPALGSQTDLTRALLGREDAVVDVARASSHPGPTHVLIRGFDEANDQDGDGERDVEADAGLVSTVEGKVITDETKSWEPNRWAGHLFVDWRGQTYDIVGNDATRLTLALEPRLELTRPEARRYVIDGAQAANHRASAMTRERNYVVLSQEAFSSVNFSFRAKSHGLHIPVLDGTNVNFLLAAGYLAEGEENHNRFANATIDPIRFDRLVNWSQAPASAKAAEFEVDEELEEHGRLRSGFINFNDQVKFQGYQMKSTSLARGDKLSLRLFFECTGKVSTSWKIFVHMDSTGASNRIHGDHWPLNLSNDPEEKSCVGCWRTNHWMKGDIILDDFETEVPMGSPSGIYNIYMGFYTPGSDKRLKVKDYDKKKIRHDGKDRVFIGSFEVH